ncbi:hypothetical protein M413DRAFT_440599 [Hebeloma cylindrosporum]|uniref:Transcription activator GCR1-like domain-containing protein n=1 Tax=Hebeloma cylindrosporum TaxID=76867 RepID=A0A0C2Z1J0_HEBCY|nr:hypothetical protein M413DRAFT_440599 [Hebeloma cylindrosporum h7]
MNSPSAEPELEHITDTDAPGPARSALSTSSSLSPTKDANGSVTSTRDEYVQKLGIVQSKEVLREECASRRISVPKSADITRLREALIGHWFPHPTTPLAPCHQLPRTPVAKRASLSQGIESEKEILAESQAVYPFSFELIRDDLLREALKNMYREVSEQTLQIKALRDLVDRRTAVLSPTNLFSVDVYQRRFETSSRPSKPLPRPKLTVGNPSTNPIVTPIRNRASDATGGCIPEDDGRPHAFVNESPKVASTSRANSQVDLVLPNPIAFTQPNSPHLLFPPILGQRSIAWDQVFPLICRPEMLWDVWHPSKSLDQYQLDELWQCYDSGERVYNEEGIQGGIKPPLRNVELFFHSSWRKQGSQRKSWERFREIPEWVENQSMLRSVSPQVILDELQAWRTEAGGRPKGLAALGKELKSRREKMSQAARNLNAAEVHTTDPDSIATPPPATTSSVTEIPKKRKAQPIAPRGRAKHIKLS